MGKIRRSTRPTKKWMVSDSRGTIHAGARGYTVKPGTKAGDSYCARSSTGPPTGSFTPNGLARSMWGCKGKKSFKRLAKKIGDDY